MSHYAPGQSPGYLHPGPDNGVEQVQWSSVAGKELSSPYTTVIMVDESVRLLDGDLGCVCEIDRQLSMQVASDVQRSIWQLFELIDQDKNGYVLSDGQNRHYAGRCLEMLTTASVVYFRQGHDLLYATKGCKKL